MRTLITGGAGFIGSHLTEHLLAAGDEVLVLDDLSTGELSNLRHLRSDPRLEVMTGSILDPVAVSAAVGRVDRVFHLAAAVGVKIIVEHPLQSLRTNIHGTENLLMECTDRDVPILLASTSEVYGKNAADRLAEDSDRILGSPLKSRWTYAAAKGIDESFARAYHDEHGLQVSIVRLFNTVGPRQKGRYGMVVPNLVGQALREEPLTVFGDGTQTRCFSAVEDVVPAMVRVAEHPGSVGEAFNLGGEQETSIRRLAEIVLEETGSTSDIVLVPYSAAYAPGYEDMRRRVPDNAKAHDLIGFTPATSVREIVRGVAASLGSTVDASDWTMQPARPDLQVVGR